MPSVQMEATKKIMKQMMEKGFMPQFGGDFEPLKLREIVQVAQSNMPVNPNTTFKKMTVEGIDVELCLPNVVENDAIFIYIHGGGLICGNTISSRGYAATLACESKKAVYTLSYRLVPENPYPAAVDDCFAVYKYVLKENQGKAVYLIGESGGAYLSIVTALKARDEKITIPSGVIAYSAPADMLGKLNRNHANNKDFTVTPAGLDRLGEMYCPDKKLAESPYVSPYKADYLGFSPLLLAWDESESLAVDSEVLRDKAKEAGVEVVALSYPDCFHAFATAGRGTPESSEVLDKTIEFVNSHIKK